MRQLACDEMLFSRNDCIPKYHVSYCFLCVFNSLSPVKPAQRATSHPAHGVLVAAAVITSSGEPSVPAATSQ